MRLRPADRQSLKGTTMTHAITPRETIGADSSHSTPRRPSTRVRVLLVVAVAVAATMFALSVSDEPSATADTRSQVASQLRWEGLAAAALPDPQTTDIRPQIANQLRWEGIADAARPDPQEAVQLRWERLAEHLQSENARGQAAEAARWQGLAEHYGAR